ncbi:ABC transporter ATP-binding protein [Paenibacillus sp. SI8]|uniref:ABC transporter ATP-binding protein n=1 Tax=unclassified Paenibacillus TaxID=185978 RepID=UPI003467991C
MSSVAYKINNLVKYYQSNKSPANDNLSFTINQGQVFGLLGPNGAGKSTLVRQLAGLIKPSSGSIELFNIDLIQNAKQASNWVVMQPQSVWLPMQTKPHEIISTTGRLRGLSWAKARQDADRFMEDFNLIPHADKKIQFLSGGLRRLVAIAITLIGDRPIVILDEPTNDLDPEIRRVVWKRIREAANSGRTVILVTHNVVEAEQTLDQVAIMQNGRIIVQGTPSELKAETDQQIRLELISRSDSEKKVADLLHKWPNVLHSSQNRHIIMLPQAKVEEAITYLLPNLSALEDFRIITPNLEDIYFEISGREKIGS